MSDCFDHELEAFESYERSMEDCHGGCYGSCYGSYRNSKAYKPKRTICKFCNETGLEWGFGISTGWKLYYQSTGKIHKCPVKSAKEIFAHLKKEE